MDSDSPPNADQLIVQFCSFTDASAKQADDCLRAHNWDVESAVSTYFAAQEGGQGDANEGEADEEDELEAPATATPSTGYVAGGGRTLGGGPAPPSAAASSSRAPPSSSRRAPARGGGPRTIKDLQGEGGHAHDDDDSDEDTDMFAGGEKSGLAVKGPGGNPQAQINSILDRARRDIGLEYQTALSILICFSGVPRPGGDEPDAAPSRFTGRGVTLGGEGEDSRVVVDPTPTARRPPRVTRTLHLWQDGFSVDDGPLFRYDDPANAATLEMIQSGRAPLDLLNVEPSQEVDLHLDNQKEAKYVQPKKKYVPFSGSGQRLGSPTPGVATASSSTTTGSSSMQLPSSTTQAPAAPTVEVSDAQPTVTLQIRLGDGTRLTSRFNTTHTVGEVYSFVDRASTVSAQRAYALMTTFPNKELEDKNVKLGDLPELQRGGVVVQKWKPNEYIDGYAFC
ncbi:putative squalene synthase [Venturia nashicola]|uniref:Putative squalene synthase n=1 Tax=Venturia nashicola TaxID=86259 RepID=A0A4Z1P497_9PEZI|nr:putative squalene synthase [Venturia nashicola]TLD35636.1 putative squalene synthase [Venturia nashicola]